MTDEFMVWIIEGSAMLMMVASARARNMPGATASSVNQGLRRTSTVVLASPEGPFMACAVYTLGHGPERAPVACRVLVPRPVVLRGGALGTRAPALPPAPTLRPVAQGPGARIRP